MQLSRDISDFNHSSRTRLSLTEDLVADIVLSDEVTKELLVHASLVDDLDNMLVVGIGAQALVV